MLSELYKYSVEHNLTARPGFKPKSPKAYFLLSASGDYLGCEIVDKTAPKRMSPDIGSAANGPKYCNILVEKAKYPFGIIEDEIKDRNVPVKREYYLKTLRDGEKSEPYFGVLANALENNESREKMISELSLYKLKPSDAIGFCVDGSPLECSTRYYSWWDEYRNSLFGYGDKGESLPRCFITGEAAPAMETIPTVPGLLAVGGHTAGDRLICFDKPAFQSFNLDKSYNAAVSEGAMTGVNSALNRLIGEASILAGAKWVHWYSEDIPNDEDPIEQLFSGFITADSSEDEPQTADDRERAEAEALRRAKSLLSSIKSGERPEHSHARYYIMPVSGAGGRMMVRGWEEGSFSSLCNNVLQWFDDLCLTLPYTEGITRPPKLYALMIRLLKAGNNSDPSKTYERINKELAGLTGMIINAIIGNYPLPNEVAVRALQWLKSYILRSESDDTTNKKKEFDLLVYQWLKVWLLRNQRAKGAKVMIGENLNPEYPGIAYHCGRMLAVFAVIQKDALGNDVNAGVIERYYSAASTNPGLVIGRLTELSNHHLAKMENQRFADGYRKMISEIAAYIGAQKIPVTLNMEQKTEFALGYYQQCAEIYHKRSTKKADENGED